MPEVVHEQVFAFVAHLAERKGLGLLAGQTVAIDATLLEANAAMKTIRRRDNGDYWKAYVTKLGGRGGTEGPKRRRTAPLRQDTQKQKGQQ